MAGALSSLLSTILRVVAMHEGGMNWPRCDSQKNGSKALADFCFDVQDSVASEEDVTGIVTNFVFVLRFAASDMFH